MVNISDYFAHAIDPKTLKLILVDRADDAIFTFQKVDPHILRWRCQYDKLGCDAYFKTNESVTTFERQPSLYHNHAC